MSQQHHAHYDNTPTPTTMRIVRAVAFGTLIGTTFLFIGLAIIQPEPYANVWELLVAHVAGGQVGNAMIGVKRGFSAPFILLQSFLQDLIVMSFLFPWLVKGFNSLSHLPYIGPGLTRLHELALEHHHKIKPYGFIGLVIYVFIPLGGTGPLVGVVIGYMIGMSTVTILAAVTIGNTLSAAAFIYGYDWINQQSAFLAWILIAIVVGAIMLGFIIKHVRTILLRRRGPRKSTPTSAGGVE